MYKGGSVANAQLNTKQTPQCQTMRKPPEPKAPCSRKEGHANALYLRVPLQEPLLLNKEPLSTMNIPPASPETRNLLPQLGRQIVVAIDNSRSMPLPWKGERRALGSLGGLEVLGV